MTGRAIALGPCWVCGEIFEFDVDRVPSVFVDPVTNKPADLGGDPARARREPVCENCCAQVNPMREARGLPPLEPLPDPDP